MNVMMIPFPQSLAWEIRAVVLTPREVGHAKAALILTGGNAARAAGILRKIMRMSLPRTMAAMLAALGATSA